MKRLVATALVALMLASCQEAPKGYVINGEVTGRTEGKVYLKSFRNKMFFDVDTAELKRENLLLREKWISLYCLVWQQKI